MSGTSAKSAIDALDSGIKLFHSGTHRTIPPEETLRKVRPFLPVMGITRIANVTGLDCIGIPVVMVCRPNSRSIAVSQGKGTTLIAAKASGVMESIEGYHAERITLPLRLASYEELRYTHALADVNALPRPNPDVFHPNAQMLWIEARDLLQKEDLWLPYELVHLNYTLPLPTGSGCFIASSDGLASGNHILEAVSHAICELVERDAVTLWRLRGPAGHKLSRVDPESIDDESSCEILAKLEQAGLATGVWDVTSDVGIPAFFCFIAEEKPNPLRRIPFGGGAGCHPCRRIALLRALTEAAQCRLTAIAGSRDDFFRSKYDFFSDDKTESLNQDFLAHNGCPRNYRDIPNFAGETMQDDVDWELQHLESAGFQRVLVVDLTRPEFRIPVARVVIPGLEPGCSSLDYSFGRRARAVLEAVA
jgi:YcaO-like protein with predicted kinase domain